MASVTDLLAQRQALDAEIAAAKPQVVAQVRKLMSETGVTLADLGPVSRGKVPAKYRDDAGNTWTGRGRQPLWVTAAVGNGVSLESLKVR